MNCIVVFNKDIGIYIFRERIDNRQIYVRIGTGFDTRSMKIIK